MGEYFWLGLVHIFMIDLVLSSDNAVVIGMACRGLPRNERKRAILYGTMGAILLRIVLTTMTTWMLDIPLVKAIGGILLLWIACKLMLGENEELADVSHNQTIGQAVRTIIVADFVMSLDNVLAVGGAAHGDLWLVLLGLAMSIPLLMWGSVWIARMMNRFPSMVIIGGGILTFTAVEMCLQDPYVWKWVNPLLLNHMWLPVFAAVVVMFWGRMKRT
ncbi:TerC family protein [Brevibacillus sp. M2.1A]|uniref:TerC family protein n=1 Tax=Brevibacillus TaxID=55080 RepID=UPI00156BD15B|nr:MULTISPECIES: TerC family protein [Brevibacillus]MCC8437425.1 TerC family protein [Brevibacillus sp. M2.1A]MCE0450920.1 TerC family protein [Brevibacillus sp. AF8]MCM3145251.1 TerC family protein [Brevibacillus sp. MER 51]UKK99560.1 TerC family protein [Brevibacillus brevis]